MEYSKILENIISGQSLEASDAYHLMSQILAGDLSSEKISGLLVALRCKGETTDEILGFVKAMRDHALRVTIDIPVVDTCGTGGDGAFTFNISTTAAFIAAGAGVPITKHHNRSVSSRCGSADVLETLGIDIYMPPEKVKRAVEQIGIGFCFAPMYHQSMKYAAPARKELGIRTVFNMLGPLLNPFLAKRQVIGVFSPHLTELYAHILQKLGSEHVFIIYGEDGLDEFTLCDKTRVTEMKNGSIATKSMSPHDFGFELVSRSELMGGDREENAIILKNILQGKPGPKRNVAILNAALAIICAGKSNSIEEGILLAEQSLDSGAAMQKLDQLVKFSAKG